MFIFKAKEYQSEKSPIFDSQKSTKNNKKTPYNVSVICCQSLPVVLQHPVNFFKNKFPFTLMKTDIFGNLFLILNYILTFLILGTTQDQFRMKILVNWTYNIQEIVLL